MRDHEADREEDDRQEAIHEAAGGHDDDPLPRLLGGQALRAGGIPFAEQADEATQGEGVDRVLRAADLLAPKLRPIADVELESRDSEPRGRKEVAERVHDNEDDEDDDEGYARLEQAHYCLLSTPILAR